MKWTKVCGWAEGKRHLFCLARLLVTHLIRFGNRREISGNFGNEAHHRRLQGKRVPGVKQHDPLAVDHGAGGRTRLDFSGEGNVRRRLASLGGKRQQAVLADSDLLPFAVYRNACDLQPPGLQHERFTRCQVEANCAAQKMAGRIKGDGEIATQLPGRGRSCGKQGKQGEKKKQRQKKGSGVAI